MQQARVLMEKNLQTISSGYQVKTTISNQTPMSSHSPSADKVSKRIELLFTKFAAYYGHIWRSQFKSEKFGEFVKMEWQEGLKTFSDAVLTQAIIECRDFAEFPPTLPQMINNCRQIKKRYAVYQVEESNKPKTQEVVEASLKQMYRQINRQS